MNALAVNESAVLVEQRFLDQYQLHVGDTVTLVFDTKPVDFYITDTINGYRGVTKRAMELMATDEDGFPIEYQMSIRSMKLELKVREIPTHEGQRLGGRSTAESLPTGMRFLRRLLSEIRAGRSFAPRQA